MEPEEECSDKLNVAFESKEVCSSDLESLLRNEEEEYKKRYKVETESISSNIKSSDDYESPRLSRSSRVNKKKVKKQKKKKNVKKMKKRKKKVIPNLQLPIPRYEDDLFKRKKVFKGSRRRSMFLPTKLHRIGGVTILRDTPYLVEKMKNKKKKKLLKKKKNVRRKSEIPLGRMKINEKGVLVHLQGQASRFMKQIQDLRIANTSLRSTLDSIKNEGHIQKIIAMEDSYQQHTKRNREEVEKLKRDYKDLKEDYAELKRQAINYQKVMKKASKKYDRKINHISQQNGILLKENNTFRVDLSNKADEIKDLKLQLLEVKNHNTVLSKLLKEKKIFERGVSKYGTKKKSKSRK